MRTTISSEPTRHNHQIGKLVWSMSLLVLTTWTLAGLGASFILNAAKHPNSSYWLSFLTRWAFPMAMIVVSLELIVVLYFYRPLGGVFNFSSREESGRRGGWGAVVGLAGGLCAFIVSLPLLQRSNSQQSIIREIQNCPICLGVILQLALLLIILPILSELVFRGVVFKTLQTESSFWPAVIGSSLLFACVWPVFNPGVAIVLGVASALVFHKTRDVVPCMITNTTLTIFGEAFLLLRRLHVV
jgi:membrane protease YdiL (CAAX protease family)